MLFLERNQISHTIYFRNEIFLRSFFDFTFNATIVLFFTSTHIVARKTLLLLHHFPIYSHLFRQMISYIGLINYSLSNEVFYLRIFDSFIFLLTYLHSFLSLIYSHFIISFHFSYTYQNNFSNIQIFEFDCYLYQQQTCFQKDRNWNQVDNSID